MGRGIGFFYTIFLARSLGVEDFGLYTVGFAYFSIISSVADFGINRYLIREMARQESKVTEFLSNIVALRLTFTSLLFAIFATFLYFFDADKLRVSIILLASLAIVPQAVALTFDGIFVALRKLQFSGLGLLASSLSTALAGFFLVQQGFGPIGAANALILGQLAYVLVLATLLFLTNNMALSHIKLSVIKEIIKGSLPYGLLGIIALLYFRIDTILLVYLRGSFETGIYGIGFRFLEAVTFIPGAFFAGIFPVFAKSAETNLHSLKKLYFKSLFLMAAVGVVVLLFYVLFLPFLIRLFLPQYGPSVGVIMILSLAVPFMFAHVPAVSLLFSSAKYLKKVLLLSVLIVLLNIILNLIFIPKYGFWGASVVTVFSEIVSFLTFFILILINFRKE